MIGTFALVLVFTSLKEGYEDLQRHKQDRDLNGKTSLVYDKTSRSYIKKKWIDIKAGELIKVQKEEEFPCDMVLLKSDKESGIVFVDTMNLDAEVKYYMDTFQTNLTEKISPRELNGLSD